MSIQLRHKALTKSHNLRVRFALRIEVRAALRAAHLERGERVLEDLLEAEELENREVHGWVETDTALVRS